VNKAQLAKSVYPTDDAQQLQLPGYGRGPCFIDFEASSLDLICSYPIEVGICLPGGVTHSWLLKPAPLWQDWCEKAAKIHGISQQRIQQEGVNIVDVAHALNEIVPGKAICDALTYDSFWLYRLFKAAKIPQRFELESLASVLSPRQINNWSVTRRRVIMETGLITHRAGNDARILYNTWLRIFD
jgi:hypothetical protein